MKMTSVRYTRNNFKFFYSWQDNYTIARLSEMQPQETETRNDQSRFYYLCSTGLLRQEVEVKKSTNRSQQKVKFLSNCFTAYKYLRLKSSFKCQIFVNCKIFVINKKFVNNFIQLSEDNFPLRLIDFALYFIEDETIESFACEQKNFYTLVKKLYRPQLREQTH